MYFVEYFQKGVLSDDLIPATGDRSVVVLDGRESLESMKEAAAWWNGRRRPQYAAYRICKGETFTRNIQYLTEVIKL